MGFRLPLLPVAPFSYVDFPLPGLTRGKSPSRVVADQDLAALASLPFTAFKSYQSYGGLEGQAFRPSMG